MIKMQYMYNKTIFYNIYIFIFKKSVESKRIRALTQVILQFFQYLVALTHFGPSSNTIEVR